MALDLEQRYDRLSDEVDHVCTGNTAYRAEALAAVGLLNEELGYGYDNDLSYRLGAAGYRLLFCRDARSRHRWREGLAGYLSSSTGSATAASTWWRRTRPECRATTSRRWR